MSALRALRRLILARTAMWHPAGSALAGGFDADEVFDFSALSNKRQRVATPSANASVARSDGEKAAAEQQSAGVAASVGEAAAQQQSPDLAVPNEADLYAWIKRVVDAHARKPATAI